MLFQLVDLFIPMLPSCGRSEYITMGTELEDSKTKIMKNKFPKGKESVFLEESRYIFQRENERLLTVQNKAKDYLLFSGAVIVGIMVFFKPEEMKNAGLLFWLILLAGLSYFIVSILFGLRTLEKVSLNDVGPLDILEIKGQAHFEIALTRRYLLFIKQNEFSINERVDFFTLSHRYLIRGIISIAILLALLALYYLSALFQVEPFSIQINGLAIPLILRVVTCSD